MYAIELHDLAYRYPDGTEALRGVSLKLETNRRLVILGANGSGKSTLLAHLNGLYLARAGCVRIFGEPVTPKNLRTIRRRVGILFDHPDNQLFATSVGEDVAFGPFNMGCSETEIKERSDRALAAVGIDALAAKPPHNLSLGQKKKAAIAGLLAMDLEMFAMDEPFSGLDPASVEEFLGILDALHAAGGTLIISTHDVDLAYAWADEIAILEAGRLVASGGPEILHDEKTLRSSNLRAPSLVQIFADTPYRPRTLNEARECVRKTARNP